MLPNFVVNRILIIEKHLIRLELFSWRLNKRCVYFYPRPLSCLPLRLRVRCAAQCSCVGGRACGCKAKVRTLGADTGPCQCCQDALGAHPGPPQPTGDLRRIGRSRSPGDAGRYQRWASGNTETVQRLRLSQWLRDMWGGHHQMWGGHHQWPEWHESKVSQTPVNNKVGEEETVTIVWPLWNEQQEDNG